MKTKTRIVPFPQLLRGEEWTIADAGRPSMGHGQWTDTSRRHMAVSLADDEYSHIVRVHETAHAAISPDMVKESKRKRFAPLPSSDAILAAEEWRIGEFLSRCGLSDVAPDADMNGWPERIAEKEENGDLHGAVCDIIGLWRHFNREQWERVWETCPRSYDIAEKIRDAHRYAMMRRGPKKTSSINGFAVTVAVARDIDALLAPGQARSTPGRGTGAPGRDEFGTMETLTLPMNAVQDFGSESYASDSGDDVADVSRLFTDCRAFEREIPAPPSGSALYDCSGSMRWNEETLAALIKSRPMVNAALYGGIDDGGRLVIVAEQGRAADLREAFKAIAEYGGNIVDGPALEWLAQQPEPRYWYSDGGISGIGDGCVSAKTELAIAAFCARNRITMIRPGEEAPK